RPFFLFSLLITQQPPKPTLFPYTTLFRSYSITVSYRPGKYSYRIPQTKPESPPPEYQRIKQYHNLYRFAHVNCSFPRPGVSTCPRTIRYPFPATTYKNS